MEDETEHVEVTTAARRITRTLNGDPTPGFRYYFDADGRVTHRIYGREGFGPPSKEYAYAFETYQEPNINGAPMHRLTERDVQKAMNETGGGF